MRCRNKECEWPGVPRVSKQEAENLVELLKEYSESRKQTARVAHSAMRGISDELHSVQKLWRQGNKSLLIKVGLALIAFPDPTISDIAGSAMLAAGLIQMKMRNSTLYVDDVYKTFPRVLKELDTIKSQIV